MTARQIPMPWLRALPAVAVTLGSGLMLLALLALPVHGQDATGTWQVTVDLGSGGTGGVTLVLEQSGPAVSGTYSGTYGSLVPLSGTAEDGRIMLAFTTNGVGEVSYDGTLAGDTMSGSVSYGTDLSGTFEASRRPPATFVSTAVAYSVMAVLLLLALRMIFPGRRRKGG